jgi:hypothetical protein
MSKEEEEKRKKSWSESSIYRGGSERSSPRDSSE